MIRASGDERHRRKLEAIPEHVAPEIPREPAHALLDELRTMEAQLSQSCRHLEAGAKRIRDLQGQVDALHSEVDGLRNELDVVVADASVLAAERDSAAHALINSESQFAESEKHRQELQLDVERVSVSLRALEAAYDTVLEQSRESAQVAGNAQAETQQWVVECETLLFQTERLSAEIDNERKVRDELAAALESLQQYADKRQSDLAESVARADVLKDELQVERSLRGDLTTALHAAEQSARALEERILALKTNQSRLTLEREDLPDLRARVSTDLEPRLTDAETQIAVLQSANADKAREIDAKEAQVRELAAELAAERAAQDQLSNALRGAEQSANAAALGLNALLADRDAVNEERELLRQRILEGEAELRAVSEALQKSQQALAGSEDELRVLRRQADEFRAERDTLQRRITGLETESTRATAASQELRQRIAEAGKELQQLRGRVSEGKAHLDAAAEEVRKLSLERSAALDQVLRLAEALDSQKKAGADLLAALKNAEQSARAAESRLDAALVSHATTAAERDELRTQIVQLERATSENKQLRSTTAALQSEITGLSASVQALSVRCAELESLHAQARAQGENAIAALDTERQWSADMVAALHAAEQSAGATEARIANLLGDLDRAEGDRGAARKKLRDLEIKNAATELEVSAFKKRAVASERKILELEGHISESEQYVRNLLGQIGSKTAQIINGSAYAKQLEERIRAHEQEIAALRAELQAIKSANLAEKAVMRDYVQSLKEEASKVPALRDIERLFIAQTEEMILAAQSEGRAMVTLIDTVQTSHFWKMKRLFRRLLDRFRFRTA